MNSNIFTLFLFGFLLLFSCKSDNKKPEIQNSDPNIEKIKSPVKKKTEGNIAAMRSQALSILNYRLKDTAQSYAIVEADLWEYQFIFDGKMSERGQYAGVWIDFKPDFTYEYGKDGVVMGSGRYHYHFERGELLMVDNDPAIKPQEWTVKVSGDAMLLVGTSTYRDNSVQIKLDRKPDSLRQ